MGWCWFRECFWYVLISLLNTRFIPGTDLLSIHVLGVQKLNERLAKTPVEFTLGLSMSNQTMEQLKSSLCVFWNHTERYGISFQLFVALQITLISFINVQTSSYHNSPLHILVHGPVKVSLLNKLPITQWHVSLHILQVLQS